MTSDKRIEPRYEVSSKVPASWSASRGPVECAASDISRHGIFLEMDAPPPVETLIEVGPANIAVRGRVVFSLSPADAGGIGRRPGVGVQLDTPIDPDTFLLRCTEARAEMLALVESGLATAGPAAAAPAMRAAAVAPRRPAPTRAEPAQAPAQLLSDVVIVDNVPGQAALNQALVADDYTPLIAKHGFEALALCIRRRPLLCIVGADAERMSGRKLLDEVRRRPDLVDVIVVLVDAGPEPDPQAPRVVRWRGGPADVDKARRLVDAALGSSHAVTRVRGPDDPRVLADAITELSRRFAASGAFDDAVAAGRYAIELAPTVPSHTLAVARMLLASSDMKQRDEAAALIERIVRQDPRSPDAYLLRAIVLDQRGRRDEAKVALRRTLMFAPSDADALAALDSLDAGRPLLAIRQAPTTTTTTDAEEKTKGGLLGKLFKR